MAASDQSPQHGVIGDVRYFALLSELAERHSLRAHAYGIHDADEQGFGDDPLSNSRYASPDFGVEPWVYLSIRANDNMRRLQAQVVSSEPCNPHLRQCFLDLASDIVTALILYEEEQDLLAEFFDDSESAE